MDAALPPVPERPNPAGESQVPAHHDPAGGFRNPWPLPVSARHGLGTFLRWRWERQRDGVVAPPPPAALRRAQPAPARPRAGAGEIRLTWVGHSTFLIQVGRYNLLTDPIWSRRASPVSWAGPARFVPPGLAFDDLPPIDAVLISHDHYDHLDRPTVRRLQRRFGAGLQWVTPLGFARWLQPLGIERVTELDWWQTTSVFGPGASLTVTAAPARHWCRRSPWSGGARLWASFAIRGSGGEGIYFGGDSGYFPEYPRIGARLGPFQAILLPIGAYAPRWFMQPFHMNPEETVRAYRELGGGHLVAMHWGTFRLSDEPLLEPPQLLTAAWDEAGLPPGQCHVLAHGATLSLPSRASEPSCP